MPKRKRRTKAAPVTPNAPGLSLDPTSPHFIDAPVDPIAATDPTSPHFGRDVK